MRSALVAAGAIGITVLVAAALALAGRGNGLDEPGGLHRRCTAAMTAGVCIAMDRSAPAPTSGVVFVAGVGAVDATAYERLRAWGDGMCGESRAACEADWDGAACRVARALYPVSAR